MRLLYVASRFDGGKPAQGESFEHIHFFDTLVRLASRTIYFDFPTVVRETGSVAAMNRKLIEVVRAHQPDLVFSVITGDEIRPATLRAIRREGVLAVNWFLNGHGDVDLFIRRYAPWFDHVVATSDLVRRCPLETSLGHAVLSQWACNPRRYPRLNLEPRFDVSFVGRASGRRRLMVDRLRDAGLRVAVFGSGWNSGRLTHAGMVRLIAESRINLNFSEIDPASDAGPLQRGAHRLWQAVRQCPGARRWTSSSAERSPMPRQINARVFEVCAAGGFLLMQDAPCLHEYLIPDREVATFHDEGDLVDRVRHYLAREPQRRAIAEAGCRRVRRDHTYEQRFRSLFRQIGLAEGIASRRAA